VNTDELIANNLTMGLSWIDEALRKKRDKDDQFKHIFDEIEKENKDDETT
jgi:hypothetical protein